MFVGWQSFFELTCSVHMLVVCDFCSRLVYLRKKVSRSKALSKLYFYVYLVNCLFLRVFLPMWHNLLTYAVCYLYVDFVTSFHEQKLQCTLHRFTTMYSINFDWRW